MYLICPLISKDGNTARTISDGQQAQKKGRITAISGHTSPMSDQSVKIPL